MTSIKKFDLGILCKEEWEIEIDRLRNGVIDRDGDRERKREKERNIEKQGERGRYR